MDWLDALRGLPPERIFVDHEPPTPRYVRAEVLLRSLVERSELVGVQADPERTSAWLIALWCSQTSRYRRGFYSCFRLFVDNGAVFAASLYCFYDGEGDSPRIDSRSAAEALAALNGFAPP